MRTVLFALLLPIAAFAADPRPNIVFVLTDDQRYDRLSPLGWSRWGLLFQMLDNGLDDVGVCPGALFQVWYQAR